MQPVAALFPPRSGQDGACPSKGENRKLGRGLGGLGSVPTVFPDFPRHGKIFRRFSTPWKNTGPAPAGFSTPWKTHIQPARSIRRQNRDGISRRCVECKGSVLNYIGSGPKCFPVLIRSLNRPAGFPAHHMANRPRIFHSWVPWHASAYPHIHHSAVNLFYRL